MVHLCIRGCNHDCAVLCLFIPQGGKPACKKWCHILVQQRCGRINQHISRPPCLFPGGAVGRNRHHIPGLGPADILIQPVQPCIRAVKAADICFLCGQKHRCEVLFADNIQPGHPKIAEAMEGEQCLVDKGQIPRNNHIPLWGEHGVQVVSIAVELFKIFQRYGCPPRGVQQNPGTPGEHLPEIDNPLPFGGTKNSPCRKLCHRPNRIHGLGPQNIHGVIPKSHRLRDLLPLRKILLFALKQVRAENIGQLTAFGAVADDMLPGAVLIPKFQLKKDAGGCVGMLCDRACKGAEIPAIAHIQLQLVVPAAKQCRHIIGLVIEPVGVGGKLRCKFPVIWSAIIDLNLIHAVCCGIQSGADGLLRQPKILPEQHRCAGSADGIIRVGNPLQRAFRPPGLPVLRTEERRFKVCARRRTFPVIIPNANRPAVFRAGMQGCARIVCKAALGRGHGPAVPNDFFRLHILHGQLVGLLGHIFFAAAKLPAKVRDTVNPQRLATVIGF